jgi:hypothetical protein
MDVEYLDGISGGAVEDFVGIASEWHHANTRRLVAWRALAGHRAM